MADTKTYTTNYNLEKPGQDDFYDVAVFNANADKVDNALYNHKSAAVIDHPDNSVTDTKIGNRTITDTTVAAAAVGTLTAKLSQLGYMIKQITGKANWYTTPAITLEAIKNLFGISGHIHNGVDGQGPKISAANVISTATGNVSATNVDAALAELEAEKLPNNLTVSGVTYTRNLGASYIPSGTQGIKVILPTITTGTRFTLKLLGFSYNTGNRTCWDATISGEANAAGAWTLTGAVLSPFCPYKNVAFGHDGTANCIILGPLTTLLYSTYISAEGFFVSYVPSATLTITGLTSMAGITMTAALNAATLMANDTIADGMRTLRDVGRYVNTNSSVIGAIKITVPAISGTALVDITIKGHVQYSTTQEKFELRLTGYMITSGTVWSNMSGTITPNAPFNIVRAMTDGINTCIVLGTTATEWRNPGILVEEVRATGSAVGSFTADFPVTLITTEAGLTLQSTATVKTLATVEGDIAPYGLGVNSPRVTDANTAILSGFYSVAGASSGGLNVPAETGVQTAYLLVETIDSNNIKQTLFSRAGGIPYIRHYLSGVWQAWKQLATVESNIAPYGLGTAAALATGDWNNYLTTGFYRGADLTNAPTASTQYFVLVMRHDDNYVTQEAWSFAGVVGLKYLRTKSSGSWSGWKQIVTTDTMGHIGDVKYTLSSTPPPGWLKANGAAISRTTYAALFAAMGTVFGAGDGSTTFNLPDLRGEFIRGWDDGRGIDASRALGSSQLDAMQNITGNISAQVGGADMAGNGAFGANNSGNISKVGLNTGVSGSTTGIKFDSSFVVRTATETRPRNVALLACIKY